MSVQISFELNVFLSPWRHLVRLLFIFLRNILLKVELNGEKRNNHMSFSKETVNFVGRPFLGLYILFVSKVV